MEIYVNMINSDNSYNIFLINRTHLTARKCKKMRAKVLNKITT